MAKDLGVMIDSSLSYNEHVTKTVSNCMYRPIRINRIKHPLDRKTLLLLINAFVFSKLFYCSTVWSNTSKTNVKRQQLVQNFAGRIVLGLRKYDHISEGLKSLKDGAYYCYCAYVVRISTYSDFLSPMLTNAWIFLRGLKLSGESRS